jgi:type I restriction enzyme S subunit
MRKYDLYKDSGIEWIGEIPSHWETKRIRHIADIFGRIGYRGYTVEDIVFDDTGAISLSPSNIENQKLTLESVTRITEEKYKESPEIMVYENDVVLVKTASVGKAAIVRPLNDLATINPQLVVFKNYRIDQTFFYYEIISRIIQDQITQDLNGGVVNTITQTNLNNYSIIVPQPEEQTAIATYLDRKTAEIDELIADKKRLLELCEEEKTAIINQAVTKGINPNVTMKDSGFVWLGDIPEHWYATSLKRLVETKITDGPHETPTFLLEGVPFVSAEAVKNGKIDFNYARGFISEEDDEKYSKKCKPKRNDIFIVKSGSTTGKIALVDFDDNFNIWSPLALVRVNKKVDFMFMYYALQSTYFQDSIKLFWSYGTQPNIGMNVIENLKVAFAPDLNEQLQIIRHIEQTTLHIDNQIYRIQKLIELLTEYRTALISEVVTGKIKVIE